VAAPQTIKQLVAHEMLGFAGGTAWNEELSMHAFSRMISSSESRRARPARCRCAPERTPPASCVRACARSPSQRRRVLW
jgi:hypothetical protein